MQQQEMRKRIVDSISRARNSHYVYGFTNEHDDKHTNGELLAAANSYVELAKQLIQTRDEAAVEDWADHAVRDRTDNRYIAPGGADVGYSEHYPKTPPPSWPFGVNTWAPSCPRSLLVRAASMIVAELERLERHDRKLLEERKPKKGKINPYADIEVVVDSSWTQPYTSAQQTAYRAARSANGSATYTVSPTYNTVTSAQYNVPPGGAINWGYAKASP